MVHNKWSWLRAFGPDDVAVFVEEYLAAVRNAASGQADRDVSRAVLHEWRESAKGLANQSLLAELATFRGVVGESEAERLSAAELRARLTVAHGGVRNRDAV